MAFNLTSRVSSHHYYFHNMEHLFHVNKCNKDNDLDVCAHLVPQIKFTINLSHLFWKGRGCLLVGTAGLTRRAGMEMLSNSGT